ncbi:MAG: CHASE domain-containing protein [Cypionkella sp.]
MDNKLHNRVEKQAWFLRYPRAVPLIVLAVALIITAMMAANFTRLESASRQAILDQNANALADQLQNEASENIVYLYAVSSLFRYADDVSRNEFLRYTSQMGFDSRARGVVGIGWAHWIPAGKALSLQAELRAVHKDGALAVRPVPLSSDAMMAVIAMLSPDSPENRKAVGFDMYSENVRRQTMNLAMHSGHVAVSGRVQLIQDAGQGSIPGFVAYLPVFKNDVAEGAAARELKGFVYIPFRAAGFLAASVNSVPRAKIGVWLYSGEPQAANLLAASENGGEQGDAVTRHIRFGDQNWTLTVRSTEPQRLSRTSQLFVLFGLVVSLLLFALAWSATWHATEDRKVLEWLKRQSAIRTSLSRELNHRVKNTLANVLSIVSLTRRRSDTLNDFADNLIGRITALSATHDLLAEHDWSKAALRDVVTSELAPYLGPDDHFAHIEGPDVDLAPNNAMSLGLALHELSTNAAKYGALSVPNGSVSVTWHLRSPDVCEVNWQESGGPPVKPPRSRGFGFDLIEKIVAHELKAPVDLVLDPAGVRCKLLVPVRKLADFKIRQDGA